VTRRTLDQAHTYREAHAALEHSPTLQGVRRGGRHIVYEGPNGVVPVPNHNGDAPRGTMKSIYKMACAAGLVCLTMAMVALLVL
jgi:predicted RNA binding protein YcfA (HicA-like mRNA interferase family)